MKAVDKQPWDPSVKALTQFPTVLDQMAKNLAWTSALGDAAFNQQKDVMAAIQKLRKEAKAAGNLKTSQGNQGGAGEPADHRDSAGESAGGVRSDLQPDGGLWHSVQPAGVQHGSAGDDRARFRSASGWPSARR